jgi:luciferase family oxidoreductase group 1
VTAYALRRGAGGGEDFPAQLMELLAFAGGGFPEDHPFRNVVAEPRGLPLPPIWILGSSDYGAQVAAALGVGFAFARHLNPRGAEAAMTSYRESFQPSEAMSEPRAILTVSGVCADSAERAEELGSSLGLMVVRMRMGRPGLLPSPEEARAHRWSEAELDQLRRYRRAQVIGDPDQVRAELTELVARTGADELMVMTMVHDHAERLRSYELLAGALAARPASSPA